MRQKKFIFVILAAMLLSVIAVAQSSKKAVKASALEVSFNYQRQAGPGSNQYPHTQRKAVPVVLNQQNVVTSCVQPVCQYG